MKYLLLTISIILSHGAISQNDFFDDSFISKAENIPYLISLPSDYDRASEKKNPLLLFLHGGDGSNTKHHPKKYAMETEVDFPFIVIAPRCNSGCSWRSANFKKLINEVADKYNIDERRIYVTGYSMGGYGTWSALTRFPDLFAAAAPICGGGDPSKICAAKEVAIKAYHAQDDRVTPYSGSLKMIEALKKCNGNATLKTASAGGHGIWPSIFKDSEFYEWFLNNSK